MGEIHAAGASLAPAAYKGKDMKHFDIFGIAWLQSLVATLGSLFFSDVMGYQPCVLCWYQRICMYPLVVILFIGFIRRDPHAIWYAAPLAIVGWCISFYHNLLYYNILPHSFKLCVSGVSCTTRYVEWLGFVTIPLLALIAFSVIIVCLVCFARSAHMNARH
jgi:disulfide bond formation protein DsbB